MAKKVIDRIFKTIMITIDVIFGGLFAFYSMSCFFRSSYDVERDVLSIVMSVCTLAVVNVINLIIRRWIKDY